eukprot:m.1013717 g.1013717  ORF g.1013717 m.1013717 type:complete len:58 (-) comp24068_c0_seq12:1921-2094(-)
MCTGLRIELPHRLQVTSTYLTSYLAAHWEHGIYATISVMQFLLAGQYFRVAVPASTV